MTRYMVDGTRLALLPTHVPVNGVLLPVSLAAVYRNGLYAADPAAVAKAFPSPKFGVLWIDVSGNAAASCQIADVETGDLDPKDFPGWAKERASLVHTSLPTGYCNRSTYPELVKRCTAAGMSAGVHYQVWISTLDGTMFTGPGVVACQDKGGVSAPYDVTVVYDDKWHPVP